MKRKSKTYLPSPLKQKVRSPQFPHQYQPYSVPMQLYEMPEQEAKAARFQHSINQVSTKLKTLTESGSSSKLRGRNFNGRNNSLPHIRRELKDWISREHSIDSDGNMANTEVTNLNAVVLQQQLEIARRQAKSQEQIKVHRLVPANSALQTLEKQQAMYSRNMPES